MGKFIWGVMAFKPWRLAKQHAFIFPLIGDHPKTLCGINQEDGFILQDSGERDPTSAKRHNAWVSTFPKCKRCASGNTRKESDDKV